MTTAPFIGIDDIKDRAMRSYARWLEEQGAIYQQPSDVDVHFIDEDKTQGTVKLSNSHDQLWFAKLQIAPDQSVRFTPLLDHLEELRREADAEFRHWFEHFSDEAAEPGQIDIKDDDHGLTGRVEIAVDDREDEFWSVAFRINLETDKVELSDPQYHAAASTS